MFFKITCAMAVTILEPPDAPNTSTTLSSSFTMINGDIDDNGLFFARIKFASDGTKPNELTRPGEEKSSMTSL